MAVRAEPAAARRTRSTSKIRFHGQLLSLGKFKPRTDTLGVDLGTSSGSLGCLHVAPDGWQVSHPGHFVFRAKLGSQQTGILGLRLTRRGPGILNFDLRARVPREAAPIARVTLRAEGTCWQGLLR